MLVALLGRAEQAGQHPPDVGDLGFHVEDERVDFLVLGVEALDEGAEVFVVGIVER